MLQKQKSNQIIISEEAEQIAFVSYLEARGLLYSAIPNSTYSPHMSVKARNKRMGVRPGVPDMVVVLPGIGLAWVELKRIRGGVVSEYQKQWIEALNLVPGNEARVCKGYLACRYTGCRGFYFAYVDREVLFCRYMAILLSFIICCICVLMASYEVVRGHVWLSVLYYLASLILFRIVWHGTGE